MFFLKYIKYLYRYVTFPAIAIALLAILDGVVPLVQLGTVAEFVNKINKFQNGGDGVGLILWGIVLLICIGYEWMKTSLYSLFSMKCYLKLRYDFRGMIIKKCARLKYWYIEDNETWEKITRMTGAPEVHVVNTYMNILRCISLVINVIGVLWMIMNQVWWAGIIILVWCVPLYYFSIKSGKANYESNKETTKLERRYQYLSEMLLEREYANERNLFGFVDKINRRFEDSYKKAFVSRIKLTYKWFVKTHMSGVFVDLAILGSTIVLVVSSVYRGNYSAGWIIAIISAFFSLSNQLAWGLSTKIDALILGNEFFRELNEFMDLDEEEGALETPCVSNLIHTIKFDNVSFRYPNSSVNILDGVSFELKAGKNYALVGINGAGKSTIIKLLTGLYRTYQGNIYIDDVELREISVDKLKGMFNVVFQDFGKHDLSILENIQIGNITSYISDKEVEAVLDKVGLKSFVGQMSEGINTLLGKIYSDGLDLSGGQWQRIAIARSLISASAVGVFDEPTAALDPVQEKKMYQLYKKAQNKNMSILISHRLASTKFVDEILVLNKGKISEKGSYSELMSSEGLYYQMFTNQKEWYQSEKN